MKTVPLLLALVCLPLTAGAQGQDSSRAARDLQVISTLVEGHFVNANQSYFDFRTGSPTRHRRIDMQVRRFDASAFGEEVFAVTASWDGSEDSPADTFIWSFAADNASDQVVQQIWSVDARASIDAMLESGPSGRAADCVHRWNREAAQFRSRATENCDDTLPTEFVLADKQFWLTLPTGDGGDFQMHRAREFECYADIPGVGGGRDEPYDRYEDFRIHDQGGSVWFESKEGRKLGISLLLVDWPINNYQGVFSRDSLVIYVSEEIDGSRKEHGYAFTVPEADRVGINLKWMLAFCYMQSNEDATPYM